MKDRIPELLDQAVDTLISEGTLPADFRPDIGVETTRDKSHGDFATNMAMKSSKAAGMKPRELAEHIIRALPQDSAIAKAEIAGPGFINFFVSHTSHFDVLRNIREQGREFGKQDLGKGTRIQVEFVSANPTGPLHVGHGRGAAYGASVAGLLEAVGYDVHREYYVNDAGRQMSILALSVWLRYLEQGGESFTFPANGYRGDYVLPIARQLREDAGDSLQHPAATVFSGVPADEPEGGDKEAHIDGLVQRARALIGEEAFARVFDLALNAILTDIKEDLAGFGIHFDEWFSERSLRPDIEDALQRLERNGHLYQENGATWFRATTFGDDKDRVVRRDNGETTYFASDIAYHLNKFERGFDKVINVWGADHHGYMARVRGAIEALGVDPGRLDIQLVQFAILYRGSERLSMSTRSGSFVTLRELRDEVGKDAARFFYVTRKAEQHMDFDLELAKSESKDNPVYYIQYAHARVCSMLEKMRAQGLDSSVSLEPAILEHLELEEEKDIAAMMARYPEILGRAAEALEPHQLTHYLRDLAGQFHSYYNAHKVLVDDDPLRQARVALSLAVQQVLANGLELLGVNAPESM
ncbi:arginine--tRNA ligase [Halovibrio salipaludis]|uniref:Arginine--tRNA ligase n=1 Tax=Halovibrio salipaludis TaxID=2032626 RepID=A0A2A2F264_9GAMM|nr:arginine--tRNA ligase [Halovibrio salipaludis]PAU79701.1 arginine--tRNA ligase [Halovibrio salipaludis]